MQITFGISHELIIQTAGLSGFLSAAITLFLEASVHNRVIRSQKIQFLFASSASGLKQHLGITVTIPAALFLKDLVHYITQ